MTFWKWVAAGLVLGLVLQRTSFAQSFPNRAVWGFFNGTTLKTIVVDVDGKIIPG